MRNNTYQHKSQLSPVIGLIAPPTGPITGPNDFIVKFGSKEPHIVGKVEHSKHQHGVVPHGSTKAPVVMPPTWTEPCENGVRVGTRHVRDVKFGTPTSQKKLLSLARKEHTKGKAYLDQSPPNKSLAHKHLSRTQQCISTVYLVR